MELAHLDLIEDAGDGIFLLDTEKNFILVNRRFTKVFDYALEKVRGRPFRAFLAPSQISAVNEALARLLAGEFEPPLRLNLEILDRHGHAIPVELTASVVKHGDSVSGIMGIVRETGGQKAMEEAATSHAEASLRSAEEWATLYNIRLATTLSLNPAEVLRLVYAQLPLAVTFSAVAIGFTGPGGDEVDFELVVQHGEPLSPFRRKLDEDAGLCGWVVREARPLLIGDWQDDDERNRIIYQARPLHVGSWEDEESSFSIKPVVLAESVRSWLGVPLVARGHTIGIIALFNETPYAYDEHHQRFLFSIADQAAMAIDNARLYEEQRRRTTQVETVHEVSQRIASILDVDDLLNQVVALIQSHRGYDHVHIFLANAERTGLEFRAGTGPAAREMLHRKTRLLVDEHGFVSWVAATGESIFCNDVTADPRYRRYEPLAHTKAEISVPLRTGGQVLGVLDVQSEWKDAFDEGDLFVLQSLADMVAVSVQTAHLFREQERRIEELTTLHEIGETIVSSLDLDETLTSIMQRVNAVFQVEAGSLLLEENGHLVFQVTLSPQADAVRREILAMGQGIAGWVAQHGAPLLIPDARADDRWYPGVDAKSGFETRSILCVPMKAEDKVIGVIEIFNPIGGRQFTEGDRRLLESIATSAVIAIENAQLHQQTEQRLAEVSTLYVLAEQTTSSLELPVVLDAIVTTLKRVLDCRGCRIFLLDEKAQQLEIKASAGVAAEGQEITWMRIGEGVSGRVVELGKPIYIPDTRLESGFRFFDEQVRSLLVVPLISKDQSIGTLSVDDLKPHAFDADDSRLLAIAAAQVAVAIENARLFKGLKERAQKLEEAYAELQEADRKKDEFFQNVSHELRTPLTFVKAYVELFLEETLGSITDPQRESLKVVAQRTEAIIRLVNDILVFKQPDWEAMSMVPLAMGDLVRKVVQGAQATMTQAGLSLRVEVAEPLPLVHGDRDRLAQVLDNLLGNAIKFSPDGGNDHSAGSPGGHDCPSGSSR